MPRHLLPHGLFFTGIASLECVSFAHFNILLSQIHELCIPFGAFPHRLNQPGWYVPGLVTTMPPALKLAACYFPAAAPLRHLTLNNYWDLPHSRQYFMAPTA